MARATGAWSGGCIAPSCDTGGAAAFPSPGAGNAVRRASPLLFLAALSACTVFLAECVVLCVRPALTGPGCSAGALLPTIRSTGFSCTRVIGSEGNAVAVIEEGLD